jgi:hypothetical protein
MKNLQSMLHSPQELSFRLTKLESFFSVSCVLFKKYRMIFHELFNLNDLNLLFQNNLSNLNIAHFESNSVKRDNCDLFKFGWIFFVYIKSK